MKLKLFMKGLLIAGTRITEVERRTGDDIRRAKSPKKRHRIPATLRARISYALVYANTPAEPKQEPMTSDAV